MRKVNYSIRKESYEVMRKAGRLNPSLEIIFRDKTGRHAHKISAGHSDEIYVFREHGETYVLSINSRLTYVGLEIYKGDEALGDIFLQDGQVKEVFGNDIHSGYTIVRQLREYISA